MASMVVSFSFVDLEDDEDLLSCGNLVLGLLEKPVLERNRFLRAFRSLRDWPIGASWY